jgi:hypothetical protein
MGIVECLAHAVIAILEMLMERGARDACAAGDEHRGGAGVATLAEDSRSGAQHPRALDLRYLRDRRARRPARALRTGAHPPA